MDGHPGQSHDVPPREVGGGAAVGVLGEEMDAPGVMRPIALDLHAELRAEVPDDVPGGGIAIDIDEGVSMVFVRVPSGETTPSINSSPRNPNK